MTARALAEEMRRGRLRAEEVVRAYLERIDRYDGKDGLNAVREINPRVLEEARALDKAGDAAGKPLYGLPLLIKDNIDVAGLHTTAGSMALADNRAVRDAPVVANLRRSGALILGKTNMTEFANYTGRNMPGGYSSLGGQVRSAYGREISPSGSSAGSAVAVSAGLCAGAVGTDTSFSIIACATVNGVTGWKPARGSLENQGIVPIARSLDSAGPLTGDLRDALLLYEGMAGRPAREVAPMPPEEMRLAVNVYHQEQVSSSQMQKYRAVLLELTRDGARIAEVSHAHAPEQREIMRGEFREDLEDYLASSAAERRTLAEIVAFYHANPGKMLAFGAAYLEEALPEAVGRGSAAYRAAKEAQDRVRSALCEALRGYDACLMTGPTNAMHFAGLPSVALRMGMGADGTPRGMILYGAREDRLLAAALTIEAHCPPVSPPDLESEGHTSA